MSKTNIRTLPYFLAILLTIPIGACGQKTNIGLKAGLNLCSVTGGLQLTQADGRYIARGGYSAGLFVRYHFQKQGRWFAQTEALYTVKGFAQRADIPQRYSAKVSLSTPYVQSAWLAGVYFDAYRRWYAIAGMAAGVRLGGSRGQLYVSDVNFNQTHVSVVVPSPLPVELSARIGLGFHGPLKAGLHFYLDLSAEQSLTPVSAQFTGRYLLGSFSAGLGF